MWKLLLAVISMIFTAPLHQMFIKGLLDSMITGAEIYGLQKQKFKSLCPVGYQGTSTPTLHSTPMHSSFVLFSFLNMWTSLNIM